MSPRAASDSSASAPSSRRRARRGDRRERCRRRARAPRWRDRGGGARRRIARRRARAHASRVVELEDTLREAQSRSSAQRSAVATVQQQIQVSAAEARGVDERLTQAEARRERLVGEEKGLVAIEPGELEAAQRSGTEAEAKHHAALAALADWQARVPALDEERKSLQDLVNEEGRRHAELSARLAALQALQEKVQVENKLKPWLARHGLESLAGLWTRIRIEPGWEAALEAALRERLGALEIGRLDTVRAFAADAPPSRLAFFTAPNAAHPNSHQTLPRLADLLHLGDAGLSALLGDWLEGVYTASDLDEALAARSA